MDKKTLEAAGRLAMIDAERDTKQARFTPEQVKAAGRLAMRK